MSTMPKKKSSSKSKDRNMSVHSIIHEITHSQVEREEDAIFDVP